MSQPRAKLSIRVGAAPMAQDLELLRNAGLEALLAGLRSVAPQKLMADFIKVQRAGEFTFWTGQGPWNVSICSHIIVIGGGKASAQMCEALVQAIDGRIPVSGTLNVPHGSYHSTAVSGAKAFVTINSAAHPLPDISGQRGVESMVQLVKDAPHDALVIALISGGGSALMPAPADGISLAEKQAVNKLLIGSGAAIEEINTVRKHLSSLKGGQLARLAFPRRLVSFILSDVVGNDLQVIASGPTVPDSATFTDALNVIDKCASYSLTARLPAAVKRRLEEGAKGTIGETPKPSDPCFGKVSNVLIGSANTAAKAARKSLANNNFETRIFSNRVSGEAADYGQFLVKRIDEIMIAPPQRRFVALIGTGELTVTLRGNGKGGRNQEMLLSFLIAQHQLPSSQWVVAGKRPRWAVMAGAFDGIEGNSECFGAVIDSESLTRTEQLGIDTRGALKNNDSNRVFRMLNDALVTGHTQTNVNGTFTYTHPLTPSSDMIIILLDFGPSSRL